MRSHSCCRRWTRSPNNHPTMLHVTTTGCPLPPIRWTARLPRHAGIGRVGVEVSRLLTVVTARRVLAVSGQFAMAIEVRRERRAVDGGRSTGNARSLAPGEVSRCIPSAVAGCIAFRHTDGMAKAISVRLDDEAERALRLLESTGVSRSEAIRSSLLASADRMRRRRHLAAEVAALEADGEDRDEMLAVASLMESMRASR